MEEKKSDAVHIGFDGIHVENENDSVHISREGIHVESQNGDSVHIDENGVHISDETMEHKHEDMPALGTIVSIVSVIGFLLWGFLLDGWAVSWTLFLLVPVVLSLVSAVRHRDAEKFAYPVLVCFVYLFCGMMYQMWHPYWIEFLTIPLYYSIVSLCKHKK